MFNPVSLAAQVAQIQLWKQWSQALIQQMTQFWTMGNPVDNVAQLGTTATITFNNTALMLQTLATVGTNLGQTLPNYPSGAPLAYPVTFNPDGSATCVPAPATTPTGLAIAAGVLTWTTVSGALSYILQRSVDGGSTWTTASAIKAKSLWIPAATTAQDSQSVAGNQYRIAAITPAGTSAFSSPITA